MENKDAGALGSVHGILNACGVAAPVDFTAAVVVAGALHPGYSHVTHPISLLAAKGSPYRDLMTYGGMIPRGALTILFPVAVIRRGIGSPGAVLSGILLALLGAGRLLAEVFPCDPGCMAAVSVPARLRLLAANVALVSGSLSPLAMAFAARSRRFRKLFFASLWLCVAALAGSLLVTVSRQSPLLMPYFGASQRLTVGLHFAWMIFLAVSRRR